MGGHPQNKMLRYNEKYNRGIVMSFNKIRMPAISNSFLIWAVVIFIALAFGNASKACGFDLFSGNNKRKNLRCDRRKCQKDVSLFSGQDGIKDLFGGNILFIGAIVLLLVLCKDNKIQEKKCDEECVEECVEDCIDDVIEIDEDFGEVH